MQVCAPLYFSTLEISDLRQELSAINTQTNINILTYAQSPDLNLKAAVSLAQGTQGDAEV